MRFTIKVRQKGSAETWDETYDRESVCNEAAATRFGREVIANFNNGLRSKEKPREFVSAEILGAGALQHQWEKQNAFTQVGRGTNYDVMRCTRCGITGKRYGLSETITRDLLFQALKWKECRENTDEANAARAKKDQR
jgi:hypothetical protein